MTNRKTGILGGTFNPVHRGHIDLGLEVARLFSLDRVLYIVSARPPHKRRSTIPPADIRFRMLQEALRPFPELQASDLEIGRPDLSWTVTTLHQLQNEYPRDRFFFITGSEGFLKIKTWKEYKQVLAMVVFIIVLRRSAHETPVRAILASEGIESRQSPGECPGPPLAYIISTNSPLLSLSSTRVRRKARAKEDVSGLVEPGVKAIMEEKGLYESE